VPQGFKGKFRVEVQPHFGPFEVKPMPPEWLSVPEKEKTGS
jgi:hypothetical protein